MKIYKHFFSILLLLTCCLTLATHVYADSQTAYKDYLYQADVYRQNYNDFSIAKNEYSKFKTLASEQTAISKTKDMLAQRSRLLRAYLLMLTQRINEANTMSSNDKQLYQSLISNEVAFLENHSKFVESVATIQDCVRVSGQLEGHYVILATSIRQIILGLTVSRLTALGETYSGLMVSSQVVLNEAKSELPLDKQIVLDRWFQQISDKRTLFLQKIDAINQAKSAMKATQIVEVDTKFKLILPQIPNAEQELKDGTSYMGELMNAMRYKK